jgi:TPR repeat protein
MLHSVKALPLFASWVLLSNLGLAQTPVSVHVPDSANPEVADLGKKALEGNTKAQLRLALAFEFGQGVQKNLKEAIHWYQIAADRGDPIAQTDLGYLYETGGTGYPNPAEAAKWYLRAAVSGFVRAQFNLGTLYLQGAGVEKNAEQGAFWISKAADAGCPKAIAALGFLYAHGMGVPLDTHRADELARKSKEKHDSNSCSELTR